ncbi:MAG: linear amide C-N hydrolase, partial [Streptococcus infantarius]
MCTAITYTTKDSYFGRNLDLDFSYNETVTICPRTYPFSFKHKGENKDHYAMIG